MKTYITSEQTVYTFVVEYTANFQDVSAVLRMYAPQAVFNLDTNTNRVTVYDASRSELDEIIRELARLHDN